MNKNMLKLIKQSYQTNETTQQPAQQQQSQSLPAAAAASQQQQLDLKTLLSFLNQIDPTNIVNSTLPMFAWLKLDSKLKWDQCRPVRLNQDNQREDDLRRLREISACLVRFKSTSGDENKTVSAAKPLTKSTAVAAGGGAQAVTISSNNSFAGGIYCRVENEWRQRNTT